MERLGLQNLGGQLQEHCLFNQKSQCRREVEDSNNVNIMGSGGFIYLIKRVETRG